MRLITKKKGRFKGSWAYAVPQEQRRTPTPNRKIRLAPHPEVAPAPAESPIRHEAEKERGGGREVAAR